eukprot:GEMP01018335.1.p1 GENE.GEMP01018335.1~~GEMP01018335.1.p1  ORF type:complete len:744 (+),score=165.41 GEMP01018335.1:93-2324(+)
MVDNPLGPAPRPAPPSNALPFGSSSRGYEALQTLSTRGKEKMKLAIAQAQNMEELQILDRALQHGELPSDMAQKLGFDALDFVGEELEFLTASGIVKIKAAIDNADTLEELNALDEALRRNTLTKSLGKKLGFTSADFVQDVDDYDPFEQEPEPENGEEDYDPFDEDFDASDIEFDDLEEVEEFIPQGDGHIEIELVNESGSEDDSVEDSQPKPPKNNARTAENALDGLVGYDSDEEKEIQPKVKRRKVTDRLKLDLSDQSDWFKRWLGMSNRTKSHPSFMRWVTPPERTPLPEGWRRAEEAIKVIDDDAPDCRLLSLVTVTVFAGDPAHGFDPFHLARVVLVNQKEKVVYDELVRPALPILDMRSHTNGLAAQQLMEASVSQDEVRQAVSDLLGAEETILIGHCLHMDCVALRLCFGPKVIDTALVFGVEGKSQHYHPLRTLASHLLKEDIDMEAPHCSIQDAVWNLRLAQMESIRPAPTPSFPSIRFPLELKLNHIPRGFTMQVAEGVDGTHQAVKNLFPTAVEVTRIIWKLMENDPSEWRGEATVRFSLEDERDRVFNELHGVTDVFVQWHDPTEKGRGKGSKDAKGKGKGGKDPKGKGKASKTSKGEGKDRDNLPAGCNVLQLPLAKPLPNMPSLAHFISEHALIQAFSSFGIVVAARIPRKPITGLAQNFGFVGFLHGDEAERAAEERSVEVRITPNWTIRVKANVAKYGNDRDKRIPTQVLTPGGEMYLDWIHVIRR